jgi:cell division protein ZapA
MPVVDVTIGTRNFQLACQQGEEPHIIKLAEGVNTRLKELGDQTNTGNEVLLLAMTALMMQDELNEHKKTGKKAKQEGKEAAASPSSPAASEGEVDAAVSETIHTVADYVEALAEKLETR